jgi:hypothetical protein
VHDTSEHRAFDLLRTFIADRLRRGGVVCAVLLESFADDFNAALNGGRDGAHQPAGLSIVDGSGAVLEGGGARAGGGGGGGGRGGGSA